MKVYNRILVRFLIYKNREIFELTGLNYINRGDLQEIMRWNKRVARRVSIRLNEEIADGDVYGLNYTSCPWCLFYFRDSLYAVPGSGVISCEICSFGSRHGICLSGVDIVTRNNKVVKFFRNNSRNYARYKKIFKRVRDVQKINHFTFEFYNRIWKKAKKGVEIL